MYDDPAIAIAWLLERGAERIAYVDVDVHHGDGPQAIFYREPRVLTISLHQTGRTLFPGTGFVEEWGAGEAIGTKVNVPLPPSTGDDGWFRAFEEIVPPLVEAGNGTFTLVPSASPAPLSPRSPVPGKIQPYWCREIVRTRGSP